LLDEPDASVRPALLSWPFEGLDDPDDAFAMVVPLLCGTDHPPPTCVVGLAGVTKPL